MTTSRTATLQRLARCELSTRCGFVAQIAVHGPGVRARVKRDFHPTQRTQRTQRNVTQ